MSAVSSRPTSATTDTTSRQLGERETQSDCSKKKMKSNWRIELLAQAKLPRPKYQKPDETFNSGVAQDALSVEISDRNEHMSRPPLRTLVVNKRQFSGLPTTYPNYEKRMDKKIEYSWNSMYNYYKKAKRDLAQRASKTSTGSKRRGIKSSRSRDSTRSKGKKGKGKEKGQGKGKKKSGKSGDSRSRASVKSEEEIEKERAIWLSTRALPKVVPQPEPIKRGPVTELEDLKDKMNELAVPNHVTAKFIEREEENVYKISEAALTYDPTERMLELAKPTANRMVKEVPIIPGAVKPDALLAVATPRITELATPRVAVNAKEADLKEDPFAISPNALKYVATPRILELARPLER